MLLLKEYSTPKGWKKDLEQTKKDFRKFKGITETLYWDLYHTVGNSSVAGLGNGLANYTNGESFKEGFGEAYINNFPLGIVINLAYPIVFKQLEKTRHYRSYANLFTIGVKFGFLAWHYFTGTSNPIQTMILNTAIGLAMTNKHVSETQDLETLANSL